MLSLAQVFGTGAAIVLGAVGLVATADAQETGDIGKYEYRVSCAVCHGDDGKGGGSLMKYYNKQAADLTALQKNNVGVFPFDRVYAVIDGREALPAHGPRDMPVWGDVFSQRMQGATFGFGTPKDLESYTRGQIIALIGYIYTLQSK